MAAPVTEQARRRLERAHHLWHLALAAYPSPDEFVAHVNALISALRTVTWVLQKALTHQAGFREWYAGQQTAMRSDDVMQWLVQARNQIEKEGDLEMRSTARASVVAGWNAAPTREWEMPPLLPPHEIALLIAPSVPAGAREEAVLRVERRWVTDKLPDHELLEACAHVYGVLDDIVTEAEYRFGTRMAAREYERLPCMLAGPDARSAILDLASGDFVGVGHDPHTVTAEGLHRVEGRYGDFIKALSRPEASLEGRVKWQHEMARGMFLVDGGHETMAFLMRQGQPVLIVGLDAEDQQSKYLLMAQLAQQVLARGVDEVILTGETWTAPALEPENPDSRLRAGQREDRTEGLVTYGIDRLGRTFGYASPIVRTADGAAHLEDMEGAASIYPQTLLPVWRAWHGPAARAPWDSGVSATPTD
jgi:hypothetical protein